MNRIKSKPLAGFILNPFGVHAHEITFQDQQVTISARQTQDLHLDSLAAAPSVAKGLLGSTLKIRASDRSEFLLKGARYDQAISFSEAVRTGWEEYNIARFEAERLAIEELIRIIKGLSEPERYPSACILSLDLSRFRAAPSARLSHLPFESDGAFPAQC